MKTLALIFLVPVLVIGFVWAAGHFLPPPGTWGSARATRRPETGQVAVVPCDRLPAGMRVLYC